MKFKEKVCVLGLGYIGLPTASLLATRGYRVFGVDISRRTVEALNSGRVLIREPDLDVLVEAAIKSGALTAHLEPQPADIFIIAVPTPLKREDDQFPAPDLSHVEAATLAVAKVLKEGDLIILESTSPVGTTEQVQHWIRKIRPDLKNFYIAYCPERVLPGRILEELLLNDRVVGGIDPESTHRAAQFYRTFVEGQVLETEARTAELCKLVENAFRDVNIAFANELSMVCEHLEVDVWELIRLANHHPRVNILQPGPGVGGHCIAVDPWFIVASAPEQTRLIQMAREVNDSKPLWVIKKILSAIQQTDKKSPVVSCFGATFKADIDDLRESPALKVIRKLQETQAAEVIVCEPYVDNIPGVPLVPLEEALKRGDIAVLLVDHKPFREIDRRCLAGKTIIDVRGIWT